MRRRILCLVACALATPFLTARADHSRPFKGNFDFATIDVQVLSATEILVTGSLAGNETHLGLFVGQVQYVVDLVDGSFSGSLYKEAANGDLLYQTLTGVFTETGSEGDFVVTGGTGRFVEASGGGTFIGTWTDAALTTAYVTFDGSIDY